MFDMRTEARRRCTTRRDRVMSGESRVRVNAVPILASSTVVGVAVLLAVLLPLLLALPAVALAILAVVVLQRRALADLAAGATLLLAQPYAPGERVSVYLDDAHEIVDAEVLQVHLLRTVLCTGSGMLAVRNAHMLRTAPGYDAT